MPTSWSSSLNRVLSSLPALNEGASAQPRLAVVGIGNEFNADDCVGPRIARSLAARFTYRQDVLIVDAGTIPENVTGILRRFKPDLVLLIDAVDLAMPVGTIQFLAWDTLEGMDAFTHGLPPAVFGRFLSRELGCQISLIGIQPASLRFDQLPHPAVKAAIQKVVRGITRNLP